MSDKTCGVVRRQPIGLLLLAALLVLPFLHLKPFYSKGEPREALVPQRMLATGDWVLPARYGERIATKPPMAHWLMALASLPAGRVSEASARLPSALLSIAAVLVFYAVAASAAGAAAAFAAAVLLLGSVEWHRASVTARVDMTLAAFLVLALLYFFVWLERGARRFPWPAAGLMACATLSKGPVGVVLPLAVALPYMVLVRRAERRTLLLAACAAAAAALLALVWYVLAYRQGGDVFLGTVFSENIARFTGTMQDEGNPHEHTVFYLIGTVAAGMLPWTALLFFAPWRVWLRRRGEVALPQLMRAARDSAAGRFLLYSVVTILAFLLFYSIPASKRSVYLLPIYPFLCLFTAELARYLMLRFPARARAACLLLAGVVLLAALLAALLVAGVPDITLFARRPDKLAELRYYRAAVMSVRGAVLWQKLLLVLPIVLAAAAVLQRRRPAALARLSLASFFAALLAMNGVFLPLLARAVSGRAFAEQVRTTLAAEETLVTYRLEAYAVDFYLGGRIRAEEISSCGEEGCKVLLKKADLERLTEEIAGRYRLTPLIESSHGIGKAKDFLLLAGLTP